MTTRSAQRRTWLSIWLLPMIFVAVTALCGLVAVAAMVSVQDGRYWFMGMIATGAVFTVVMNMRLAWEATL